MKKITNGTHLEGYLFGHTLELKVSGPQAKTPGTEFIAGTVEILTDDALNVVPVTYRYVVAKYKSGKDNATYKTLMDIINSEGKTYQECGTDALKLKADTALGVNDFYTNEDELVSYKVNDGGFLHIVPAFTDVRNYFEVDMLITNAVLKDADPDRETDAMVIVKGNTFNFRGDLLPIDLVVKAADGMDMFLGLEASLSQPVFLKVWGHVICSTIETQTTEESSFGEDAVKISSRKLREWVISGAAREPYALGDEAILTSAELTAAMAAREVFLAETKTKHDDYMKTKNGATPAAAAGTPQAAGTGTPYKF